MPQKSTDFYPKLLSGLTIYKLDWRLRPLASYICYGVLMKRLAILLAVPLLCPAQPLKLAIAGSAHGHVSGFLNNAVKRPEVQIVGIFDPGPRARRHLREALQSAARRLSSPISRKMLDSVKPEAVATFTSTYDHAMVVEACATRHIPVMMEKPLAVNMTQARAIQQAAARGGIPVIVNYETTWYRATARSGS